MKIKSLLRIVVSCSLVWSSSSFADVRVGADLSPEQLEVLDRARASDSQIEWRVLTKEAKGKPRTVVLVGEPSSTLPKDTMIAKKVIDQFEHFAVEASGPFLDRESAQVAPNSQAPMNLPPLGARVKTIQNAEANYQSDGAAFGYFVGLGYFLMTGWFSGRFFFEGFPLNSTATSRVLYNMAMLAISAVGSVIMLGQMAAASVDGSREKAVADFVNSWVNDPQYDQPVVLIVSQEYVSEIERVLVDQYAFRIEETPAAPRP